MLAGRAYYLTRKHYRVVSSNFSPGKCRFDRNRFNTSVHSVRLYFDKQKIKNKIRNHKTFWNYIDRLRQIMKHNIK